MFAAFYGYASAVLLFALAAEADTTWLKWVAVVQASWLVLASSLLGYRAARQD